MALRRNPFLTSNMRVHLHNDLNAAAFSDLLLTVGDEKIPCTHDTQTITVPEELCHIVSTEEELFDKVYDNLEDNHADIDWLMERAILAPLNETVNAINNTLLNRFPGNDVKPIMQLTAFQTKMMLLSILWSF